MSNQMSQNLSWFRQPAVSNYLTTDRYVKVYDKDHNWVMTFSDYGSEPGENIKSEFMDIYNGRLYMPEAGNHRVNIFDLDGNFVALFGDGGNVEPDSAEGLLNNPEAAKISSDEKVYLRGVLEIVKAAGYKGLLIVIDEAETILRMRTDSRHKSLNGLRQISDASGDYPKLLWIFTGTPEFYDSKRGVAGLPPLHDRISFSSSGRFASLRQAQLELKPFDKDRLKNVAMQLRELYPASDRGRLMERVSDEFLDQLVEKVTEGFRGDVGVVPRQFLREFVTQMDLVDEHEDYMPMREYGFEPDELLPQEQAAVSGAAPIAAVGGHDDAGDAPVPYEDVW